MPGTGCCTGCGVYAGCTGWACDRLCGVKLGVGSGCPTGIAAGSELGCGRSTGMAPARGVGVAATAGAGVARQSRRQRWSPARHPRRRRRSATAGCFLRSTSAARLHATDRVEQRARACELRDRLHEGVLAQSVEIDVRLRDDRGVGAGAFDRRGDRPGARGDELVGGIDVIAGEGHAPTDGDAIGAVGLEHDQVDRRGAQRSRLQPEREVGARARSDRSAISRSSSDEHQLVMLCLTSSGVMGVISSPRPRRLRRLYGVHGCAGRMRARLRPSRANRPARHQSC